MTDAPPTEFQAFKQVHDALVHLDEEAQARIVTSVSILLGIASPSAAKTGQTLSESVEHDDKALATEVPPTESHFTEFAELYAEADPAAQSDKALVGGYWLQVCQGAENFSGQSVNNELNHLGHKIANITNAMTALNDAKPQLVLQLRKSGKSQQARKTYKLSAEGVKRVKAMIDAT